MPKTITARLDRLESMLANLLAIASTPPAPAKTWYTVAEAAEAIAKAPYTVREWCRHGRLAAEKAPGSRPGLTGDWRINAAELARYRSEGLRPEHRVDCPAREVGREVSVPGGHLGGLVAKPSRKKSTVDPRRNTV